MPAALNIEPVSSKHWDQAVHFLAGGGDEGVIVDAQAQALTDWIASRDPGAVRLWRGMRGRNCVAAAMILENVGRTGFLLFPPLSGARVDPRAVEQVVRAASQACLEGGVAFVQAFLEPEKRREAAVLQSAGYALLAELIYMRLDLATLDATSGGGGGVVWRTLDQCGLAELTATIEKTYQGSLDCPGLAGLRNLDEVIASHKANGVFQPDSWWIAEIDGRSAGCVLLNGANDGTSWDVVYLGVCPVDRGRRLGRGMLAYAAEQARLRGVSWLTLAVDKNNTYARNAYETLGFRETRRRCAYLISLGREDRKSEKCTDCA